MDKYIKIRFDLSEWGPSYEDELPAGETLWAETLGENRFRLQNIPMFVDGFAYNDVVRCVYRDGWFHVAELVEDGKHGTIFVKFVADVPEENIIDFLHSMVQAGCTFEKMADRMVAINVPPTFAKEFSERIHLAQNTLIADTFIAKPLHQNAST
jgi:hypothetical protein